jgi:hypothetical protein
MEYFVPAETNPHELVEADKMVDMGMGDEDVAHSQQFPRGEKGEVTYIEEDCPPIEKEIDIETRVAKRAVDKGGMKEGLHCPSSRHNITSILPHGSETAPP